MQEKLQHFYDVSVESAEAEARAELDAYQSELEKKFAEYKKTRLQQIETERKLEQENVKRQLNKEISMEQLTLRRRVSRWQDEKKDMLFAEVKAKLEDFRRRPEYVEYLYRKFKKALAFAGHDEIQLLLSSGDGQYQDELEQRLSHPVRVMDHDFGGGICAVILARNIQIDESFVTLLDSERQEFVFQGGATHG